MHEEEQALSRAELRAINLIRDVRNKSDSDSLPNVVVSCIFMIPMIERLSVVCAWPDKRAHFSSGNMPDIHGDPHKIIQTHLTPCAVQIKREKKKRSQSLWVMNCQHKDKMSLSCQWRNQARKGWCLGHWVVLAFPINITRSLFAKPVLPLLSDSSSPFFCVFTFLLPYLRHLDPFLNLPAQKPDTFSKKTTLPGGNLSTSPPTSTLHSAPPAHVLLSLLPPPPPKRVFAAQKNH